MMPMSHEPMEHYSAEKKRLERCKPWRESTPRGGGVTCRGVSGVVTPTALRRGLEKVIAAKAAYN